MVQYQTVQIPELRDCKVARHDCLLTLLPADANSNVRLLDHPDVVRAVPNRQGLVPLPLHQRRHLRLLQRGHAAAHHRHALGAHAHHELSHLLVEHHRQRAPVDDQGVGGAGVLGFLDGRQLALQLHLHQLVRLLRQRAVGHAHHVLHHVVQQQAARRPDVDGRLHLVPRQHPHVDAAGLQLLNRFRDAVLQLVLDGGGAQQLQVLLNELGHLLQLLGAVVQRRPCEGKLFLELRPLLLAHLALRQAQRAQALLRALLQVLLGLLGKGVSLGAQPLENDVVRALAVQPDLPVGLLAGDDGHTLASGVELQHPEDLVLRFLKGAVRLPLAQKYGGGAALVHEQAVLAGGDDEGQLVGRLSLVRHAFLGGLALGNDGVAKRQDVHEVVDHGSVGLARAVSHHQPLVAHVEALHLGHLLGRRHAPAAHHGGALHLGHALAVHGSRHRHLEQLHDVARERARFVREHRLNHPQLLVEVGGAAHHAHVQGRVVHAAVVADEVHLGHLHQLDGDVERDGNEVAVQNEGGDKVPERHHHRLVRVKVRLRVPRHEVVHLLAEHGGPRGGEEGPHETHRKQQEEHEQDDVVDLTLHRAALAGRSGAVHHHLGLVPRVHHHAEDRLRVAKAGAPQEQVARVQRHHLAVVQSEGAVEGVDAVVGRVALDAARHLQRLLLRQLAGGLHRGFDLEVGLAVQVHRLHVARALRVGRPEEEQVRGEVRVARHLHQLPHAHLHPGLRHKLALPTHEHQRAVHGVVRLGAVPVLHALLHQRNREHRNQREDAREGRHGGQLRGGQHCHQEEVDVAQARELLVQAARQEGHHVVLGGGHVVALVPHFLVSVRLMHEHLPLLLHGARTQPEVELRFLEHGKHQV
mmetsp:Transcript_30175/g.57950  ORF Transcript_30175/g.57950 Transcript_30175/m.57950 type:complete len:865 (-) Transcript_30175:203-2797(-)